jgi:hypothetical protein
VAAPVAASPFSSNAKLVAAMEEADGDDEEDEEEEEEATAGCGVFCAPRAAPDSLARCTSKRRCSTVSRVAKRRTTTGRVWPRRCTCKKKEECALRAHPQTHGFQRPSEWPPSILNFLKRNSHIHNYLSCSFLSNGDT